jgi:hypothetical protein
VDHDAVCNRLRKLFNDWKVEVAGPLVLLLIVCNHVGDSKARDVRYSWEKNGGRGQCPNPPRVPTIFGKGAEAEGHRGLVAFVNIYKY